MVACSHRGGEPLTLVGPSTPTVAVGDELTRVELARPQRPPLELAVRASRIASAIAGRHCRWTHALRWARRIHTARSLSLPAAPLRCDPGLTLSYLPDTDYLAVERASAGMLGLVSGRWPKPPATRPGVDVDRARAAADGFVRDRLAHLGIIHGAWVRVSQPGSLGTASFRTGHRFHYQRQIADIRLGDTLLVIGVDDTGEVASVRVVDVDVQTVGTQPALRSLDDAHRKLEELVVAQGASYGAVATIERSGVFYRFGCTGEASLPELEGTVRSVTNGGGLRVVSTSRRTLSLTEPQARLRTHACDPPRHRAR